MTSRPWAIAVMVLSSACADKPTPVEATPAKPPKAESSKAEVSREVRALKAPEVREAPVPVVDPARVAIEEDFLEDAARRITKRSNLDAELARLAAEINANEPSNTP
jgi:hypothetical protein